MSSRTSCGNLRFRTDTRCTVIRLQQPVEQGVEHSSADPPLLQRPCGGKSSWAPVRLLPFRKALVWRQHRLHNRVLTTAGPGSGRGDLQQARYLRRGGEPCTRGMMRHERRQCAAPPRAADITLRCCRERRDLPHACSRPQIPHSKQGRLAAPAPDCGIRLAAGGGLQRCPGPARHISRNTINEHSSAASPQTLYPAGFWQDRLSSGGTLNRGQRRLVPLACGRAVTSEVSGSWRTARWARVEPRRHTGGACGAPETLSPALSQRTGAPQPPAIATHAPQPDS